MKTLQLKTSLFLFIFFAIISVSFAQEKSPAHVGLFYPVSTHGTQAADYINNFSFHVFTGLSGGETGAAIYGLAGIVKGDVQGAQISGLYNNVSEKVTGVQIAGILNRSADATRAAQIAGISNINLGNAGFQVSGIFNTANTVIGTQIAGILNVSSKITGVQAAGIANLSKSVTGTQLAGIASVSSELDGAQLAGIANASKNVKGTQIAGILNVAENVEGTQIAGLVNRAKKVTGVQIGLINIADSSDLTIGVVNIVKHGDKRLGVSVDENLNSFLTFRSGGKRLYGIIGLGTNFENRDLCYGFEAGLGLNLLESDHFRLDAEVVSKYITDFQSTDYSKFSFQLLPALKISQNLHLFAGPSISYAYSEDWHRIDLGGLTIWDNGRNDDFHGVLFGFTAGINVRF